MRLARVLGHVVAETRHPDLKAKKLLWIEEIDLDDRPLGRKQLAVDHVDAGPGDRVLVLDEGNSAAQVLNRGRGAIRTVIVGFVDNVETTWPEGKR